MRDSIEATAPPADVNTTIAEYKKLIDDLDEVALVERRLNKDKAIVVKRLLDYYEASTLEGKQQLRGEGITITIDPTCQRVGYDPENWGMIVNWAGARRSDGTDMSHCIQRRLSSAPIMELIDKGIPVPGGIRLETFTKLSHRRNR